MCFGGGGDDQYDAYKSGDFANWKRAFDQKAAIDIALARGEITQQQADERMGALTRGTPGQTVQVPDPNAGQTSGRDSGQVFGVGPQMLSKIIGGVPGIDFESMQNQIKQDPSGGMELREVMRQHDVNLGRIGIDKAFNQFGDNYYDKYKSDFTGYYTPQLDEQFAKATDKTTASLADRGMLESSVGANTFADLSKKNAEARTNISNEALDAANKLRGNVENAKSSLYSLNEASANPQAVNAQAVGQATALVAPPQYSPLGEVFASALNSLSSFQNARNNSPTRNYASPFSTPSGYGSGSVIR